MPLISNLQWAIISLSLFAGAFNIEIFRSGIEAIPKATMEAGTSLGLSRWQNYRLVILPMAIRVCLPALGNNLVNLVKTTNLAYAIAVPELLYVAKQIWGDSTNVREMMFFVLFAYLFLVFVLVGVLHLIERRLAIPGFGQDAGKQMPQLADAWSPCPACLRPAARRSRASPCCSSSWSASAPPSRWRRAGTPKASATEVLIRWMPLLLWGFAFNILISIAAMAVGTVAGVPVGIAQLSQWKAVRIGARASSRSCSATRPGWCCCSCACS